MSKPPRFPIVLLRLIADRSIIEEIEGDLYEDYLDNIASKGLRKARSIYRWTALRSLRPYLLAHKRAHQKPKYTDMVLYYLKMAFRSMSKNRSFTAINIFGLTIGLASSLAILLFIIDQSLTDDFQANQDRIYRLEGAWERGGAMSRHAQLHYHLLPAIANNIPGIEDYARITPASRTIVNNRDGNRSLVEEDFLFTDPSFFKVFNFRLLSGNKEHVIDESSNVVITESAAIRHFGNTDVVGKSIEFSGDYGAPKVITGVLADPPGNSSIQFDFITLNTEMFPPESANPFNARFTVSTINYLLLSPGTSRELIVESIINQLKKHTDKKELVESQYSLNSFQDLKYDIAISDNLITPVDRRVIQMFSLIALFIIALALINYINLTSTRFIQRANEIGVRKVVGATRSNLIGQMLMESLVICFISLPFALLSLNLIVPYFEGVMQQQLSFDYTTNVTFISGLLGGILLLATICGLYPALLLSKLKLTQIQKGGTGKNKKASVLRKVLVVFQFTFSIALIICAFLVQRQLDFVRTTTLSYSPEHIVVLDGKFGMMRKNHKTVKAEIEQIPGVLAVSVANSSPGDNRFINSVVPDISAPITRYIVDEDYLDLFNLKLLNGSTFNPSQDSTSNPVIINQALADILEIEDPVYSTAFRFYGRENNKIIGVVENFHFESLRDEIKPVILTPTASMAPLLTQIIVKTETANFEQTLKQMESIWNEFFPDVIFDYQFLDDKLDRLYTAEYRLSEIFGFFTVLAIVISCLGLFGLSMHMTELKLKEVSIRKVLGASMTQIMGLLSKQVFILIGLAGFIASPLAWYFIRAWLQDFAYKQSISFNTFAYTLIACMLLATLTISWHTLKTARTNPADTLRNE